MNLRPAILGAADGVVSISGLIAAGARGTSHSHLAIIGLGAALAATWSMANAELASEEKTDWPAVGGMAVGTLAGGALPVVPLLLLGGALGWVAVVAVAVAIALIVGRVRCQVNHRPVWNNELTTLAGLAIGFGLGLAIGA